MHCTTLRTLSSSLKRLCLAFVVVTEVSVDFAAYPRLKYYTVTIYTKSYLNSQLTEGPIHNICNTPRCNQQLAQTGNKSTETDADDDYPVVSTAETRRGLFFPAEVWTDRKANLRSYESYEDITSDNESSYSEESREGGIKTSSNFDPAQFLQTWNKFRSFAPTHYIVENGMQSKRTGKVHFSS